MVVNGSPQYQLVLQEGINRHVLGEGLNPLEQEWLAEVINQHLGELLGVGCEVVVVVVWKGGGWGWVRG
jgi:hypothetical protein